MAFKGKKELIPGGKSKESEFVQRFKTSPFIFGGTIFVLIIIIIAFVLAQALGALFSRNSQVDLTFGHYEKIPISYVPGNYFAQYYEWISQYYRNTNDANNMFVQQRIWRDSFEAATFRIAMLQEMKRSGYSVPHKVVDKEVAQQFMENGRFSQSLYDRYDNNARLALWRRTQDNITLNQYNRDIEGLLVSAQAEQFIGKMGAGLRSFDLVSFPVNSYPDSEISSYAEEHADLFRQVHLSRITIYSGEREARQILKSIKDGTITFEDAARAHSQDYYSERGGDMGLKPVHELYQEIPGESEREQVIALGKDQLSEVLKIGTEWVFFRAEEEVQDVDMSDASTLDRVRSYIQTFERGRMEDWAFENANNFITAINEKGLEAALFENGLTKQSFGPISINYGDSDLLEPLASVPIPELRNASSDENFWKIAFSTEINMPSEPFVQDTNVLVLFPTSEEEADEERLESIRSAYSDYWLRNTIDQSLRLSFLNSSKFEDRFMETFMRYLMPQDE